MTLEWKARYNTGEANIDAQHRGLFQDVQTLLAATEREALLVATMALLRNSQSHFEYEEKVMRRIAYPELPQHFKEHTDLMDRLTAFSQRACGDTLSATDVEEFVVGWLLGHITSQDAKLATYIWTLYPNWNYQLIS